MKPQLNLNKWLVPTSLLSMISLLGMPTIAAALTVVGPRLTPLQPEPLTTTLETIPIGAAVIRPSIIAWWGSRSSQGRKSQRKPGGTRGSDCVTWSENEYPTALIPEAGPLLTVSERPIVWLYLPYTAPNTVSLKFELKDNESQERLEETLVYQLNSSPKLVRFQLPSLVIHKSYKWSFLEVCDDNGRSKEKLLFYGEIERISVDFPLSALPGSLSEYRERGLWLDALNGIAELRMINRNQSEWSQLLGEVNLNHIASAPFADSVDPR